MIPRSAIIETEIVRPKKRPAFSKSHRMKILQLPLFLRKKFESIAPQQTITPVAPTAESTVMQTLPAYAASLGSQEYSQSTQEKYFADIKKFSLFLREKKLGEITTHDIEQCALRKQHDMK